MKKLNLAIVGLGEGRSIISAARSSPHWNIRWLCDLNATLLESRLGEMDDATVQGSTSLSEVLSDPEVDVVAIYTPDPLHAEHVLASLKARKHVICTKPFLSGLEQAARVHDAWRASGRQVFIGQSSRFFEPMLVQRRDYEAGRHGELVSVEAHYHHDHRHYVRNTWGSKGGLNWVYGGLSHPVDLVCWYLPDIAEVMGYGHLTAEGKTLGITGFDTMHFIMRSNDGRVARVSGCYSTVEVNQDGQDLISCVLRGTRGSTQANYLSMRYFTRFENEPDTTQNYVYQKAAHYFRFVGFNHHAGEFQNYLDYFAESLDRGLSPKPDALEGLRTVTVLAAMNQSLLEQKPIAVAEVMKSHGLNLPPLTSEATYS